MNEWEALIRSCDRQKWIADGNPEEDFEWDRPPKIVNKMFRIAVHESRLKDDVRSLHSFTSMCGACACVVRPFFTRAMTANACATGCHFASSFHHCGTCVSGDR